jgi:hypothetical protein
MPTLFTQARGELGGFFTEYPVPRSRFTRTALDVGANPEKLLWNRYWK